jgi:hypothetical protein
MRCEVEFSAELFNHAELLNAENQFAAFHSLENKQELGHNFRAAAHTGYLRVTYIDFPAPDTGRTAKSHVSLCRCGLCQIAWRSTYLCWNIPKN